MDLQRISTGILKEHDPDTLPSKEKIINKHARRRKRDKHELQNKINGSIQEQLLLKKTEVHYNAEEMCIIKIKYKSTKKVNPTKNLIAITYTLADDYTDNTWESHIFPVYFNPNTSNGYDWNDIPLKEKKKILLSNQYVKNKMIEIENHNIMLLSWEDPQTITYKKTSPLMISRKNINQKTYDISIKTIQAWHSGETKSYLEAKAKNKDNPFIAYASYEEIPAVVHEDKEYKEAENPLERAHALKEKYNLDILAEELTRKTISQLEEQALNVPTLKIFG